MRNVKQTSQSDAQISRSSESPVKNHHLAIFA